MMQNLKLSSAEKRNHGSLYVKYLSVFINDSQNWKTHVKEIFSTKLTAKDIAQTYYTTSIINGLIFKRIYNTICYDNKSITDSTVRTWNDFQTIYHGHSLLNMLPKT